jgi:DNA processing protein
MHKQTQAFAHNNLHKPSWQATDWAWLALTELKLSFSQSRQLIEKWPDIEALFYQVDLDQLQTFLSSQQRHHWQRVRKTDLPTYFYPHYTWLQANPAYLLTFYDADFPQQLKLLDDCPGWLWVQGNRQLLADPAIAMVGGRRASPSGLALATEYAQALATAGLTIVSGLAIGVDGASHAGALTAQGDTIAVLGSGLAKVYPVRHQHLAQQIVANNGALVSPWPLFLPAMPYQFPIRNSLISGLSLALLVVEAAQKSGSLITAKTALEQGREVFALPASPHNKQAQGGLDLISDGAHLVYTPQQILAELAPILSDTICISMDADKASLDANLSTSLQQLLNQFGSDPLPIDIICQQLALPYAEVAAQLMELTLLGYLVEGPKGYERIG